MSNFIIHMKRRDLLTQSSCDHAGLFLDKGFTTWAKDSDGQYTQHNQATHEHHQKAAQIFCLGLYKKVYENWKQTQVKNKENSRVWFGKLTNRMYLGMGEASPLEAGITLHHTYGVPFIPGSAIKGVISHYFNELDYLNKQNEDDEKLKQIRKQIKSTLFGTEASSTNKQDSGSAGSVIFNDAWWIPEDKALAPEIVTVHAVEYYKNKGKNHPHPDFESPNPNPQIAIQGSFFFSVEGTPELAEYAIALLKRAMQEKGIGGKTSSGYGYFDKAENKLEVKKFETLKKEYQQKEEQLKKKKQKAIKEKIYAAAQRYEQLIIDLEQELEKANNLSDMQIKQSYSILVGKVNRITKEINENANTYTEQQKESIKISLNKLYDIIGWYKPKSNSKQKKKQRQKKEMMIERLFK